MSLPPRRKKTGFPQPWEACRFLVARPKGVEPLTKSLEGSCSILLSYGRTGDNAVQLPADSRVSGLANSPRRAASSVA